MQGASNTPFEVIFAWELLDQLCADDAFKARDGGTHGSIAAPPRVELKVLFNHRTRKCTHDRKAAVDPFVAYRLVRVYEDVLVRVGDGMPLVVSQVFRWLDAVRFKLLAPPLAWRIFKLGRGFFYPRALLLAVAVNEGDDLLEAEERIGAIPTSGLRQPMTSYPCTSVNFVLWFTSTQVVVQASPWTTSPAI